MDELVAWKESSRRKPLILNGARQVGKTWLLKEFGRLYFENVAYVSLDNDSLARSYFDSGFDIVRIIASLSLELDMDIQPGKTLIVLDEVQACPKAITSLKYFCENAPEYAVAAAGSLLGISATEERCPTCLRCSARWRGPLPGKRPPCACTSPSEA